MLPHEDWTDWRASPRSEEDPEPSSRDTGIVKESLDEKNIKAFTNQNDNNMPRDQEREERQDPCPQCFKRPTEPNGFAQPLLQWCYSQ